MLPKNWQQPDYSKCPEPFRDGMRRYLEYRIAPGHFLCCVLENDLAGAIGRADAESLELLKPLVQWVYNEVPSPCWGTKLRVHYWVTDSVCPTCRETPEQHAEREGACGPTPEF